MRLATLLVDDRETAEDVVQDAFAGLQSRHGHLLDPANALAYLRAAVLNNARSALRRRRTARSFIAPHVRPTESAESLALLNAEHRQVLAALRRLPRRQREVLVLRYWADLSVSEVADTLGISTGTVKSTAARGLSALSRILEVTP